MSSFLPDSSQAWLVLKFGGTSVSNAANWHNIANILKARIAEGFRPVVVHSALSGITDRLESLLAAAKGQTHPAVLNDIELTHRRLAEHLKVVPNQRFEDLLGELRELTEISAGRG